MDENRKMLTVSLLEFLYAVRDFFASKRNLPFFPALATQAIEAVEALMREANETAEWKYQYQQAQSEVVRVSQVNEEMVRRRESIATWYIKENSTGIAFEILYFIRSLDKIPMLNNEPVSTLLDKNRHDAQRLSWYALTGNMIGAIKHLRAITGTDLRTAKDCIEALYETAKNAQLDP